MSYGYGGASVSGGGFSRSNWNEAKAGAYPTEVVHSAEIGNILKLSEDKETSIFDPCINKGEAVIAAFGRWEKARIFGVELQQELAEAARENPRIEAVVNEDYLNGYVGTKNCFSVIWANYPYMTDWEAENGQRMEKSFLEKSTSHDIKMGGVIVLIIPYRVISEIGYVRYLMRNYDRLALFRFREDEYQKWQQVVFIGRKKTPRTPTPEELQAECSLFYAKEEDIPVLPHVTAGSELYQSIEVEPSDSSLVKTFTSKEFDSAAAYELLKDYDLADYRKLVSKKLTVKPFSSKEAGRPPIPPKNDIQYLRAVSGEGTGYTGEEGVDLHLQRGVAEVIEDVDFKKAEDGSEVMVSTTHTDITMTLIETDGRITTLK